MRKLNTIFVLFSTALVLSSCKDLTDETIDPGESALCTLMGSMTTLTAKVTSATPLPSNVRFTLNNSNVEADECSSTDSFNSNVKLNSSRTEAEVTFFIDGAQDVMNYYFPGGVESGPQAHEMSLDVQSRNSCTDNHVDVVGIDNITLSWKNVYANGESCGVTSHSGNATVDLN